MNDYQEMFGQKRVADPYSIGAIVGRQEAGFISLVDDSAVRNCAMQKWRLRHDTQMQAAIRGDEHGFVQSLAFLPQLEKEFEDYFDDFQGYLDSKSEWRSFKEYILGGGEQELEFDGVFDPLGHPEDNVKALLGNRQGAPLLSSQFSYQKVVFAPDGEQDPLAVRSLQTRISDEIFENESRLGQLKTPCNGKEKRQRVCREELLKRRGKAICSERNVGLQQVETESDEHIIQRALQDAVQLIATEFVPQLGLEEPGYVAEEEQRTIELQRLLQLKSDAVTEERATVYQQAQKLQSLTQECQGLQREILDLDTSIEDAKKVLKREESGAAEIQEKYQSLLAITKPTLNAVGLQAAEKKGQYDQLLKLEQVIVQYCQVDLEQQIQKTKDTTAQTELELTKQTAQCKQAEEKLLTLEAQKQQQQSQQEEFQRKAVKYEGNLQSLEQDLQQRIDASAGVLSEAVKGLTQMMQTASTTMTQVKQTQILCDSLQAKVRSKAGAPK